METPPGVLLREYTLREYTGAMPAWMQEAKAEYTLLRYSANGCASGCLISA